MKIVSALFLSAAFFLRATALVAEPAGTASRPFEISNAAQPQLAVAADGRVWLVYGQGKDIFTAHSDDGGKTFSEATKVATAPNLRLGMRRGPRIAARGDVVIVTAAADELVAYRSSDAGRTWSGPVPINDAPKSASEGLHDLALAPNGELFVTWLDLRNGAMELWGATSSDGGKTWTKNEQIYRSPDKSICTCCHPSALFDRDGNLAVMWRNAIAGCRDLWMTTRPAGAQAFGPPQKLGQGTWKLDACPMDGGKIIALGGGKFGAVWQRDGAVFYAPLGGQEVRLGAGKQPVAIERNTGPLFFWQQGSDLVTASQINASAPTKFATDARFPSLALLPDGRGAVLAYERFSTSGKPTDVVVERL